MKFLFYLGHPAHYHNVSIVSEKLKKKGHEIIFAAREKDVLFKLLAGTKFKTYFLKSRKGKGKLELIFSILKREWDMLKICRKEKPDLMAGTDIVIVHIGRLLNIPTVILNEDEPSEIPLFAKYGMQYAKFMLSPDSCNVTPYEKNNTPYHGYHELAYLHPKYFSPDKNKAVHLFRDKQKYFILRFSKLSAHHDVGKTGITDDLARKIIELLKPHGKIYITSEREFSKEFEHYRISVNPKDMHHVMAFAALYIGDSQTMAAEAAVLGIPSLRFNDFVGKLGYLEELEHKYGLTYGIKTSEPEKLLSKIKELISMNNLKELWREKKQKMLNETIDVADFWIDFFQKCAGDMKMSK